MTSRPDKLNKKTLAEAMKKNSTEVYNALMYAYNNSDKPKSVAIRMEKILTKVYDDSANMMDQSQPTETIYQKIEWPAIYNDRKKGFSNSEISKKYGVSTKTLWHHFKFSFDPLKQ